MAMAADGRGHELEPWPRPGTAVATDMPTSTAAMSTAIYDACDVGTATSAAATDTAAAYQKEGGRRNRSKRNEKRRRRKERDMSDDG